MEMVTVDKKTFVGLAKRLFNAQQERLQLQAVEEQLKDEIKALTGMQETDVGGFAWYKQISKGSVNYKSLVEFHKIDVESYRGAAIESWRLKITKA
jgi:hypothetical protein